MEADRAPITRVARACEPCRARKTRCDISEREICSECTRRSMEADCVLRDRARPKRAPPAPRIRRKKARVETSRHSHSHQVDSQDQTQLDTLVGDEQSFDVQPDLTPSADKSATGYSPFSFKSNSGISSPVALGTLTSPPIIHRIARPARQPFRPCSCVDKIEEKLLKMIHEKLGLDIDIKIPPERIFDNRASSIRDLSEIGLGGPNALNLARHWINLHFTAIHHNTPFLNRSSIELAAQRMFGSENSAITNDIQPDEKALLLSVLALGSFREATWDGRKAKYRQLFSLGDQSSVVANQSTTLSTRTSQSEEPGYRRCEIATASLFLMAQAELDNLSAPSELAVQALFLLHNYVSNTSMDRRSRDFVARAVMMSHEIGLNRRIPRDLDISGMGKSQTSPPPLRAVLYLYVYFADIYLSALDSYPPLIKSGDFDSSLFDPILSQRTSSGTATPPGSSTAGLSAFVDLVKTGGQLLETLHGGRNELSASHILMLEANMDSLRDRLGDKTFKIELREDGKIATEERAIMAGRLLRQTHYNWFRIALRAPFLDDPYLGHSSLAICARSAVILLSHQRHVCLAGLLNLPWMQLRRITSAIEIVFIAYWKGELLNEEAEQAIDHSLLLFSILGTRWKSSWKMASVIAELASKSNLKFNLHTYNAFCEIRDVEENMARPSALKIPFSDLRSGVTPFNDFDVPQEFISGQSTTGRNASNDQMVDMMDGLGAWLAAGGFELPTGNLDLENPRDVMDPSILDFGGIIEAGTVGWSGLWPNVVADR